MICQASPFSKRLNCRSCWKPSGALAPPLRLPLLLRLPLAVVLPLLNFFARIPVCGLIAQYNATELPPGPNQAPLLFRTALTKRLTIRGFIVWDFAALQDDFLRDVSQWIKDGRVKYREDIVEGIDKAPRAFIGLLRGENFGKMLVKLA